MHETRWRSPREVLRPRTRRYDERVIRTDESHECVCDIRAAIDRGNTRRQMMREPQIIVTEVRDDLASRLAQAFVVRATLMARVPRQIDPAHARIIRARDDILR